MASIMIVEDDLSIRYMLREALRERGHKVMAAVESVHSAMDYLKAGRVPDLVLLDIILPGGPGTALMDYLRENHKDTKILLATGLTEEQVLRTIPKDGYDGYFLKPFDIKSLREKVDALTADGKR